MRRFAENVKVRELWSVTDKTELNNGISNELKCVITEHEARLCEFALTIAVKQQDNRDGQFKTLRDKLRKLGYEYH